MNTNQKEMFRLKVLSNIEQMLVPHTAFRNGLESLEQSFRNASIIRDPIGYFLCGESRSGKSRLAEEFLEAHPEKRTERGLEFPVLYVTVPSKPTVKGLAAEILRMLKDPMPDKGTEQNMTSRLLKLLKECQVRVLILDEAQHFVDKSSNYSLIHHVSDWLKLLLSESKVVTVIAGLQYAQMILSQNEQLRGRFANNINLPRFNWENESSRSEFLGLLAGFNELMAQDFTLPNLGSNNVALRFYLASGGLTGYVFNILRKSVWNVVDADRFIITLEDLDLAYRQTVSEEDQHPISPFCRDFDLNNGQAYMLAKKVGRRSDDYVPNKISRSHLK